DRLPAQRAAWRGRAAPRAARRARRGAGRLLGSRRFRSRPKERQRVRLSTKGRYAVMAMVDLAKHCRGEPISLAEIAERQEISLSYLEQLFAKLRAGSLVKSVRGPGGGYLLARGAD